MQRASRCLHFTLNQDQIFTKPLLRPVSHTASNNKPCKSSWCVPLIHWASFCPVTLMLAGQRSTTASEVTPCCDKCLVVSLSVPRNQTDFVGLLLCEPVIWSQDWMLIPLWMKLLVWQLHTESLLNTVLWNHAFTQKKLKLRDNYWALHFYFHLCPPFSFARLWITNQIQI